MFAHFDRVSSAFVRTNELDAATRVAQPLDPRLIRRVYQIRSSRPIM